MITYVVHIDERPVVAFRAVSHAEARELIKEMWFQTELQSLTSDGMPLWSDQAKVSVRAASAHEAEAAAPSLSAENPGGSGTGLSRHARQGRSEREAAS